MSDPTDAQGRYVWVVTWGRPGRTDWRAVLVLAYEAEEACNLARDANRDLLPPDAAVLAAPATARSVLDGRPAATVAHLPLLVAPDWRT
ncbi:MAG: hypothetical protein QOK43_2594 [Acidimicrobiaceae bacterium]|nr:hypothetical protein [Acidimicrobiaceae bacterium]MDQ1445310.1 hypothetical protein [Acidimicrobiaceae bacterium]